MNRKKQNMFRCCASGVAAILVTACLVMATGTSFARYRTEYGRQLSFSAQPAPALYLGTMGQTGTFDSGTTGAWELEEGVLRLDFAVANAPGGQGTNGPAQRFRVRLNCSADARNGTLPLTIKLMDPTVHDMTQPAREDVGYVGNASSIPEDSLLRQSFGEGWTYIFTDSDGQELTWSLEGGVFSCAELALVMVLSEEMSFDPSLLQLQIVGEPAA